MFLRGKEKRSEGDGDQSIIGDIPIRSSPTLLLTSFLPEKALKK